jgi:DnaK suppressor protein
MKPSKSGLDATFVQGQRQHLIQLRATLVRAAEDAEFDEADTQAGNRGGATEAEDDAQRLDALERDGNLVLRSVDRLARVDRALEKIEEGSYGLSDMSGRSIPRERLEAVPEALYTLDEEEGREKGR